MIRKIPICLCCALSLSLWSQAEDEPRLDAPDRNVPTQPEVLVEEVVPEIPAIAQEAEVSNETRFGKITVTGSRQVVRGSIASIVEKLRVGVNKLVGDSSKELKTPIIINLYGKQGDEEQERSVVSEIVQIGGAYQLRLHIHLAKGLDLKKINYHAMELLLYERGLRDRSKLIDDERLVVKPWIITGVLEALDIKGGTADKQIYRTKVSHLDILSVDDVLAANKVQRQAMDGRKPVAFQAISGALVNALLRQPSGQEGMEGFLSEVATNKGEIENLLRQHFPGMNLSKNSLAKWVNLELAELGTAAVTDVYSILETESRIDDILQFSYHDEAENTVVVGISEYQELMQLKPKQRVSTVLAPRAELSRLSYRCFPVYRPLLVEYQTILTEIATGKGENIDVRLKNLNDSRQQYIKAGERARDYLDWYYITQSDDVSGGFKEYMDLSKALKEEAEDPNKKDTVDRYLDTVQALFSE